MRIWLEAMGLNTSYDPATTDELWRYNPKPDQYTLLLISFFIYRRTNLLGYEKEKIDLTKNSTVRVLKDKLPVCKRIGAAINIFYYHTIVFTSIIIFLTMLIFMAHNVINDIS
jgi:hypothetical protein